MKKPRFQSAPWVALLSTLVGTACGQSERGGASQSDPTVDVQQDVQTNAALTSGSPVQYTYDAAGRLTGVFDPNGNIAQYVYDAVGNIVQVNRIASGGLSLLGVVPNEGVAGGTVVINGSGFSTTPANNTVKFNGTAATVNAAAAQQLTVAVPSGATTGPISVKVGSSTVTSNQNFVVGVSGPSISNFSPIYGSASSSLTVNGSNFQPTLGTNAVLVGGLATALVSGSTSQLTTTLAPNPTSGKVTVVTPDGMATSPNDFFLLPAGMTASTIGFSGRVLVNGANLNVSISNGTQAALVIFDGNRGDVLSMAATGVNLGGGSMAKIALNDPNGVNLNLHGVYSDSPFNFAPLPRSGTFMLVITQSSGATSFSAAISVSRPVTGAVPIGGPAVTFSSSRPSQNGNYTFNPNAGANLTLTAYNSSYTGVVVATAYDSGGNQLQSFSVYNNQTTTSADLLNVVAGAGSIVLTPSDTSTGSISLLLMPEATGPIGPVNGNSTAINLSSGQDGRYTFSGTANAHVDLGVPSLTTTPSSTSISVQLLDASQNLLNTCLLYGPGNCPLPPLPATATYTLWFSARNVASVALLALLSTELSGTVATNGTPTTYATPRSGQGGRYTFTATSGQSLTLTVSGCTFSSGVQAKVYDFNNSLITVVTASPGFNGTGSLSNLAAGTYTIVINPQGGDTGQASLTL